MILPDVAQCFQDLLMLRHEIRTLKLLPIKTDRARKEFKELDHDWLHQKLLIDLKGESIGVAPNDYPYFLPDDVKQLIVWIPKRDLGYREVAKFIDKVISRYPRNIDRIVKHHPRRITPADIITFERPQRATQDLVKGSFPAMRHVHLWLPR
jgi:hypothetical protein